MKEMVLHFVIIVICLLFVGCNVQFMTQQEEVTTISVVGTVYRVTDEDFIFEVEGQLYKAFWVEPQPFEVGDLYTFTFSGDKLIAATKV